MKLSTRKLKQMIREELYRLEEEQAKVALGIIGTMNFEFFPQTKTDLGHMEYSIQVAETRDLRDLGATLRGRIVGDQEGALMVIRLREGKVSAEDFANWWHRKLKSDHPRWEVPAEVIAQKVKDKKIYIGDKSTSGAERRMSGFHAKHFGNS